MSEITYKIEWVLYVRGMLACNKTNEFTATNYKKLINFISFQSHMNYLVTTDGMRFNCDDFESAKTLIKRIHDLSNEKDTAADLNNLYNSFEVKDILVNGPATIVFWKDGTKTVVKCGPEDMHDLEKAVAMCFMKKALGSRSMKKIFDLAEDRAAEQEAEDKKRMQEADRQARQLEQRLRENERMQRQMQQDIEQLQTVPNVITILFLAANPAGTTPLQLDEEARSIQQKIRMADYRDSIRFESRWATRSGDILQAINETNPTIVHFSGHGTENGDLVLLNPDGSAKLVSKEAISMAMSTASDTIRLVVFNACFSEPQAESVIENIDAAIGMSTSIGDEAACIFASQLYSSIGFGRSLQISFNQALAQLMLEGIPEDKTPKLYVKDSMDANEIILVQPD